MAKANGGPRFNGHDYHQYMQWVGIHSLVKSLEDLEVNGLAEDFMKTTKSGVSHISKERTSTRSSNILIKPRSQS